MSPTEPLTLPALQDLAKTFPSRAGDFSFAVELALAWEFTTALLASRPELSPGQEFLVRKTLLSSLWLSSPSLPPGTDTLFYKSLLGELDLQSYHRENSPVKSYPGTLTWVALAAAGWPFSQRKLQVLSLFFPHPVDRAVLSLQAGERLLDPVRLQAFLSEKALFEALNTPLPGSELETLVHILIEGTVEPQALLSELRRTLNPSPSPNPRARREFFGVKKEDSLEDALKRVKGYRLTA